jgi:magnesium chelatase family protein
MLKQEQVLQPYSVESTQCFTTDALDHDLSEVIDQPLAKRALEIAAAGSHNLLLVGPPGCGKSMLSTRMEGILPSMTIKEALEVNKIYSVTLGQISDKAVFLNRRPFRSPHHSISIAGLVGGGMPPKPGEITLAHNGVLFLDELAEFPKHMLDQLRQPLESGQITISRAKHSYTLPSRFQLVAAMNPCPCGYYHSTEPCRCTPFQISRYQTRLSGPILDRFQLYVWVQQPKLQHAAPSSASSESSQSVRRRVEAAYQMQMQRNDDGLPNSLTSKRNVEMWEIEPSALDLWQQTSRIRKLSARSHLQMLRVARTIADLSTRNQIGVEDIAESLQYTDRSQIPLI